MDTNILAETGLGFFLSNDNGNTWDGVNTSLANSDFNFVDLLNSLGTNVFAGVHLDGSTDYDVIIRSTDSGNSWRALTEGLPDAEFLGVVNSGTNIYVAADRCGYYFVQPIVATHGTLQARVF